MIPAWAPAGGGHTSPFLLHLCQLAPVPGSPCATCRTDCNPQPSCHAARGARLMALIFRKTINYPRANWSLSLTIQSPNALCNSCSTHKPTLLQSCVDTLIQSFGACDNGSDESFSKMVTLWLTEATQNFCSCGINTSMEKTNDRKASK